MHLVAFIMNIVKIALITKFVYISSKAEVLILFRGNIRQEGLACSAHILFFSSCSTPKNRLPNYPSLYLCPKTVEPQHSTSEISTKEREVAFSGEDVDDPSHIFSS